MVDQFKMIVAVFLGPSEYRLLGIYRGEDGKRVKLAGPNMEAEYFQLNREEEFELYIEPCRHVNDPKIIPYSYFGF